MEKAAPQLVPKGLKYWGKAGVGGAKRYREGGKESLGCNKRS